MGRLRRLLCALLLLTGCAKRAVVLDPTQPTCSAEPLYTVCASRAEWVVVSKSGPHDKELCPHGAICTIEAVGTMYRIRRIH